MGIDKIKKKKKKTKKYKKRMPFWGGGESYGGDPSAGADDGGPGSGPSGPSGPSGGDDGGGESYTYTAPTPDPTPTVNFSDTNEPGVSPVATTSYNYEGPTYDEEVGINTPAPTTTSVDDGSNLFTPPTTYTGGPTYDEAGLKSIDPIFNSNEEAYTGYNGVPPTPFQGPYVDQINDPFRNTIKDPKGGFLSGLKKVAKFALPFVAGPLAGAFGLAKPYQAYSTFNRGKKGLDYISKLSKGKVPTSADLLKNINFQKGPSVKGPPTGFNNDGNDGNNNIIPKNVIAAGREQYSPERINALKKDIDLFGDVIQNRTYTIKGNTINLNNSQIAQVASKRSELMQKYDEIMGALV